MTSDPDAVRCTPLESMLVAASQLLADHIVCFAGIGLPSDAAILALKTHAPHLYLMFESGALGARPDYLPLSVADSALGRSAQITVSVPEIFNYWLQPGRVDVGILGAAQVDKFANINSTLIGKDYENPKVRLPGAGGAPEIAAACKDILVIVHQSPRTFVDRVDFVTTVGQLPPPATRQEQGLSGGGPRWIVTDIGVFEPDPLTKELTLTKLHPSATLEEARAQAGWEIAVSPELRRTEPPTAEELGVLRRLYDTRGGD
jgi:glutaconate CoA-transferase subunit B